MTVLKAPIIDVCRLRMGTDGIGVTSLVAFYGCPIDCCYCLNRRFLKGAEPKATVTPEDLLGIVKTDDLYFVATNGGICFGGGEPLLYSEFIKAFCSIKPDVWRITLETSLNVPTNSLKAVAECVDLFFVDIKDMNTDIYLSYTGSTNELVVDNLRWLSNEGLAEKVIIRLPLIPGYNTCNDLAHSRQQLYALGFTRFNEFKYMVNVID